MKRSGRVRPAGALLACVAAMSFARGADIRVDLPSTLSSQSFVVEVEPNGTSGTATPVGGDNVVVRANIDPDADVDFFSISAVAGDVVYAATMTAFSNTGCTDTLLRLFASDGTTLLEVDDNDGNIGSASSSLAGVQLASAGTYFLAVQCTFNVDQMRPYELHVRLQHGAPASEVEPNDAAPTAMALPGGGWVSGALGSGTDQDWYSLSLTAGDTVFLALDLDPERDTVQWNGRVGLALFGDAGDQVLVADDPGNGLPDNPHSEALFVTVKDAGIYYAVVDSAVAGSGTYGLSVAIHPAANEGIHCTTYTSTDVPRSISDLGAITSFITVPGNPRIGDVDVSVTLNHTLMADLDVHLRSPAGNDNGLFTDIGSPTHGGQTQMDAVFDDEAGTPPFSPILKGVRYKPEAAYRLHWLDGELAGGTWNLDIRDDRTGDAGTLTAWSLRICEPPPLPPPATCPSGLSPRRVFSTDFETGAAGFTHSGASDEWELGTPNTPATAGATPVAPFLNCNSGTACWKTDLDNTYNLGSNQDLLSPAIDLAGLSPPVVVTWAQRYQMEHGDHAFVDYQQAGGGGLVRLFEFLDGAMTDGAGNPVVNLGASAGWAMKSGRADSLANLNTQLRFHVDSNNTIQLAGLAIDDVVVRACGPSGFTDDPLLPGFTRVKAVHVTELRTRVNAARAAAGLGAYTFTDPALAAGDAIKAVHITDLRAALAPAYATAGIPAPSFTDPGLSTGTAIKVAHVMELRFAVEALE